MAGGPTGGGRCVCLTLIRPARKDEQAPRYFPNWPGRRIEAIIWTLKNQLGLERHGGRVPAGLCARPAARPQRLQLAQLGDQRTGPALLDRLRSLTDLPGFPVNDPGQRAWIGRPADAGLAGALQPELWHVFGTEGRWKPSTASASRTAGWLAETCTCRWRGTAAAASAQVRGRIRTSRPGWATMHGVSRRCSSVGRAAVL
jgi:hypothetical protein